jgi:hypothetical protein
VKRAEGGHARNSEKLLHYWLGEPAEGESAPPGRKLPRAVLLAGGAVAVIAVLLLLKYAVDVLLVVVVVACFALALHALGLRLAESEILSPGWLLVIVLGILLLGYVLVVPTRTVAEWRRYVPRPLLAALDWSERRGWAHRAFLGDGGSTRQTEPPLPDTTPPSADASPALLTVGTSQESVGEGRSVTLTARLRRGEAASGRRVRFLDGATEVGVVEFQADGRTASLTVRLAPGVHEIRGQIVGSLGDSLRLSPPVRVTVVRR